MKIWVTISISCLCLAIGMLVFLKPYQSKADGQIRPVHRQNSSTQTSDQAKQSIASYSSIKDPQADRNHSKDSGGIQPVHIRIPAIKVDAKVVHVGRTKGGKMAVPDNRFDVGWYTFGDKPGAQGSSVLAGHVSGQGKIGVFFYLKKLKQGDHIYISGEHQTLDFIVNKSTLYPYNHAPLQQIFGYTYRRTLKLITCAGVYNPKTTQNSKRLVVYAQLAPSHSK